MNARKEPKSTYCILNTLYKIKFGRFFKLATTLRWKIWSLYSIIQSVITWTDVWKFSFKPLRKITHQLFCIGHLIRISLGKLVNSTPGFLQMQTTLRDSLYNHNEDYDAEICRSWRQHRIRHECVRTSDFLWNRHKNFKGTLAGFGICCFMIWVFQTLPWNFPPMKTTFTINLANESGQHLIVVQNGCKCKNYTSLSV